MSLPPILFCRPGPASTLEDDFELEADVVDALDLETHVIDADLVVDQEPDRAVRRVPRGAGTLLYRGPILRAEEYEALAEALSERGADLFVDPAAYEHALYLPEHHERVADLGPATCWTSGDDPLEAWEAAQVLGPPPWVIKDHVKSAKEDWLGACFVPEGASQDAFVAVCEGLLEQRAERFERGFVIREFLELAPSSVRTAERRIPEEHRLFFFEGALVAHAPYLPVHESLVDVDPFRVLAQRIDSPFFTADVAFRIDGAWVLVEINDGGVSVLPEDLHPRHLYAAMAEVR